MSDIFNMADTWNAGGTTFTAIKMTVTDTASAAASLLMNLVVGSTSMFSVSKAGQVTLPAGSKTANAIKFPSGGLFTRAGTILNISNGAQERIQINNTGFIMASDYAISWSSGEPDAAGGDTLILRDAANTLAQRNGANAQTNRLYGTYTDASNYRRVSLSMTTAGVASLTVQGAGTGASGNVLHISGLPTSNPGPGILWNNAGTPAIGT